MVDFENTKQTFNAQFSEAIEVNPDSMVETDPTVPEWAKQPQKPTYTAEEVGALPANTPIPEAYTLPTASATVKGGVMIGEGLVIDGDVLGVKPEVMYELVETIQINDDGIQRITRALTPHGQTYSYRAMVIELESEATGVDNITIATTISLSNERILYDYTTNAIRKNYASVFKAWTRVNNDGCHEIHSLVGGLRAETISSGSIREYLGIGEASDRIVGIDLTALANIPIGTVIKIWGVRANA